MSVACTYGILETMIYRYEYKGDVWIDFENPTEEEIREIAREFSISDRIEAELLSPTPSPMVASDPGIALLVLHFPVHGTDEGETKNQEIDFVVGSHFIVTVRYEVVASLHRLKKLLETEALIAEGTPIGTDVLLEILFAHLYTAIRDHASHSATRLARVEHEMFGGHERKTVRAIADVSREFLHLEAALANQEEPLVRFLKSLVARDFFGPSFSERMTRVLAERAQIAHLVRTYRAMATELRETNAALVGAHQNEIMKTLTVINFIFLPLGLIAWIFAMRTEGMPLIDSPNAFWIVVAIMLAVASVMTLFAARKRWL